MSTLVAPHPEAQGLTRYARLTLYVFTTPLLFIAGFQLYVLAEHTATYFAWTIASPLAAAFLGAGYWAAIPHAWLAVRAKSWATVRTSLPAAVTATALLTVTTFMHLDKFHLDSPVLITRLVTWVWMLVYLTAPPSIAGMWVYQTRVAGGGRRGQRPLPGWLRAGYAGLGLAALAAGAALFLAPEAVAPVWPWAAAPLAARATGAWVFAFGLAFATLVVENDRLNGAGTCLSLAAFCVLQLSVVARYPTLVLWDRPGAVLYLIALGLGLGLTGANLLLQRRQAA